MLSPHEIQILKQSISHLGQELLQQTQDAHGYFSTKTRYAIGHSDPATRQRVQEKLDHAVATLAIANVMAIFENRLPKKYWTAIFQDSKVTVRLKAYRHIRYSAIYGFTQARAAENKLDFDKVMAGDIPLKGIRAYSDEEILLDETAANFALVFLQEKYNVAIVKIHGL